MNPNRFLNFGGSQTDSQASGGSGGSGNFLFDIIRVSIKIISILLTFSVAVANSLSTINTSFSLKNSSRIKF